MQYFLHLIICCAFVGRSVLRIIRFFPCLASVLKCSVIVSLLISRSPGTDYLSSQFSHRIGSDMQRVYLIPLFRDGVQIRTCHIKLLTSCFVIISSKWLGSILSYFIAFF